MTRRRLAAAHARIEARQLSKSSEWNLVSGLSGIGTFLLERHTDSELLRDVLSYLVRLSEPLTLEGQRLPGWWCVPDRVRSTSVVPADGYVHTGMAHGLAGPLALLATALRHDVRVCGQAEAIERFCAWLDLFRRERATGPTWPQTICRREDTFVPMPGIVPRPSWSLGAPGVARAEQLAGLALSDLRRQKAAEDALLSLLREPAQLMALSGAGIADGWAGLLLTFWRAATDATDPRLSGELPRLRALVSQELRDSPAAGGTGLLHGSTGRDLVLYTVAVDAPLAYRWDACLLVAG
jgi:hypothetical protein